MQRIQGLPYRWCSVGSSALEHSLTNRGIYKDSSVGRTDRQTKARVRLSASESAIAQLEAEASCFLVCLCYLTLEKGELVARVAVTDSQVKISCKVLVLGLQDTKPAGK